MNVARRLERERNDGIDWDSASCEDSESEEDEGEEEGRGLF